MSPYSTWQYRRTPHSRLWTTVHVQLRIRRLLTSTLLKTIAWKLKMSVSTGRPLKSHKLKHHFSMGMKTWAQIGLIFICLKLRRWRRPNGHFCRCARRPLYNRCWNDWQWSIGHVVRARQSSGRWISVRSACSTRAHPIGPVPISNVTMGQVVTAKWANNFDGVQCRRRYWYFNIELSNAVDLRLVWLGNCVLYLWYTCHCMATVWGSNTGLELIF